MLDENLPTFYIKPTSDNALMSTIHLSQNGSELNPEYMLRRPDPALPASKNCYAVALYDPYNADVLFAEVLVRPDWTQPTLSAAEVRAQNGIPPAPIPVVPDSFTVQLYNPDQQVIIKQVPGSWNSSTYWEFEMPQNTFRIPSASSLDRSQDGPAIADITPKIGFKWKRDGKLSRDISCYLSGQSTVGKKSREPDIPVAMFKNGKNLTMYEPNMHRVEVEDVKGLEVVLLLSAQVTKDIFFNASREMFNIAPVATAAPTGVHPRRKNSKIIETAPVVMTSAVPPRTQPIPSSQVLPNQPARANTSSVRPPAPPPADARTQWEIDAETERLIKVVQAEEKARERADREEAKRIQKLIEKEDKARQKRDAEVDKETERLRKQYGVPPPQISSRPGPSQSSSAPAGRSASTQSGPQYLGPNGNPYLMSTANPSYHQPPPVQQRPSNSNSPYLQAPGQATASSSGFFGLGKKVQKKRSVFF